MGYEAKIIKRESLITKTAEVTVAAADVDTDFWTPAGGKRIFLAGLHVYSTVAKTILLYSKTGVTKTTVFQSYVAANGVLTLDFGSDIPFTVDHILGITLLAGAATVEINAWGYEK